MSRNKDDALVELTIRLRDQYVLAEKALNSLAARSHSEPEDLEEVTELLASVKQTEAELRPHREAYEASGRPLPSDLQPVVNETIGIVSRLIPRITELEKVAVQARENLKPQIHEGVRAARMQSAYSRATQTSRNPPRV
ncbi:MAG: hypothetical protein AAF456_07850 [Planctomycetota bacterium]